MIHTSQARIVPAAEAPPPADFSHEQPAGTGRSPVFPTDPHALRPIGPLEPVEDPELLFEVQCEARRYCW